LIAKARFQLPGQGHQSRQIDPVDTWPSIFDESSYGISPLIGAAIQIGQPELCEDDFRLLFDLQTYSNMPLSITVH
jgi:hypothetical protein